jgi:hypothetical protein
MRNVALAVGGALLITAGIVLAAFRPTSTGDTEGVIGPAVVVGSAAPASNSGTPGPSATPSTTVTPPTATPSRTPASPASDDHVHPVSPSPAVPVTDDHGGGRRSGRHGD